MIEIEELRHRIKRQHTPKDLIYNNEFYIQETTDLLMLALIERLDKISSLCVDKTEVK